MILGITGYIGAGKSEVVKIACRDYDFVPVNFKDAIVREAVRRGIDTNDRLALQNLGRKVEDEKGNRVWSYRLFDSIGVREYYHPGQNYVVDCFRTPRQIDAFREKYDGKFFLLAVTAHFDIRWRRVLSRERPGDPELLNEFTDIDYRDRGMGKYKHNPIQSINQCVKDAGFILVNDSKDLPILKRDFGKFMRHKLERDKQ